MSAVNLETCSLSLLAAKEDVLSARRSTDWAVFTYEKRNDLKLADSGAGGLEELARKFTENSLLYALCQVKDRNTGQSYIVLINWVGEKVDESYRQTCAAHLPAIKAFFKEASVIISTRRADEVTSEAIQNVLSSLSTASSASRKSRLTDSEELVGTNYRKTNPALEMRRSKRDSFWAQAEREEEERKEEERLRLQEERKRWDRERMEQEKREAEERDRKIREKEFMIEEQRKELARIQGEERKKEKTKWEEQQKEHEEEMRDRFRRSESIEKAAEAAVLVSQRSLNPREFFRQRENSVSSSSSPSPTSPTVGGVRRPALRYQRSLTESSYMNRKPESPTSPSPTPSPSYTRRQDFFSSMSPRTPPETCSPSMIFSKAGAPTRGGRFPFVSAPRVGAQPPRPFTRADSLPATSLTHVASLRPASPTNSKGFSPTGLIRQERVSSPPPVRHEIVMPASPPRVNSLSPTSSLREIITPPASPPRTCVSPVSITKSTPPPLDTPTIAQYQLMTSSHIVDSPQPPSPLSPTNTPHPLIPQTKDSVPSITPNEVKSPPSAVSIREESLRDHVPTRALPASPSRTASAPLATSTTTEPGPTVPANRAETPPLIVTRFEPIPEDLQPSSDLTLDTNPLRSASPPRATSPTMEMLPSLSSLAAGAQSSVISTCYEPVMDVVTSRVESSLYTDPPRSQSPPVAVSPTSESVPSLSSLAAGSSSSAMSTRYEPIPDDNKPSAEPSLHTSLLRSASPPRATSPTMESVYSLSSLATETTHSAILSSYDPTSNDVTARDERPVSASPPRAASPIFGAIRNETLVSLEDGADEEPAPRANTYQEESLISESEYTTVETSPKHDIWLEETSMGLKVQPTALLEASVGNAKTSTVHTSITEDAHQSELFFCKDSFPGQDMDTLSAMLHALPLYTAMNPEGAITNSVHSEDLSKAPGYRHAEDSEPETKSPWEELDDNTSYAGVIHTPEEPRVNGTRLNGIGGQDEEEAVHEEETGEKEAQVEPGSAPKLCTRTVYEYHEEGDERLSLDGGALIQPVDPQNEP